jgi:hypothetical protein
MVSAEQSSMRPGKQNKVAIAVLDESTSAQLRESIPPSSDLELVWTGSAADQLIADAPSAQVVLANIDLLGDEPAKRMKHIVDITGAELGIALYSFAKRELLDQLSTGPIRTLRSPVNLPMLRCQMMSIIARNLLAVSSVGITPPRYSTVQLGKLQQISTQIECECPNHLAILLQNLSDFENYSANCENRNPADAEIHRMLYESTARARALLERAMDRLIVHEQISV